MPLKAFIYGKATFGVLLTGFDKCLCVVHESMLPFEKDMQPCLALRSG